MSIMKENEIAFNKSLGQNFLIDEEVLDKIASDVVASDGILEIGAGLGVLTNKLLKETDNVVAIEFDRKLAEYLKRTTKAKIIQDDVLKVDLDSIIRENDINRIIANLPYYITSPIIMLILEELSPVGNHPDAFGVTPPREGNCIDSAKLMVQWEVGKRIVADEGSKDYGILSIACQYYAECEMLFKVPSSSFLPAPKVDSSVIELKMRERPIVSSEKDDFFRLVKAAFGQRRKTFVNSVSNILCIDKTIVQKAILDIGKAENVRAEQLSIEEFDKLTQILFNKR